MSGRYEKEIKFEHRTKEKLKTLPSVVTDYYYSLTGSGSSFTTVDNYINYISSFLKFTFGDKCDEKFYKKVKAIHINKYISSLRTKTVAGQVEKTSDSIRALHWSALNSFFQFLVPDYISKNPVAETKRPKIKDNPNVTFLTPDEISKIIAHAQNVADKKTVNRDLCILKLGLSTGLRVSAITQIDIDDIDLDHNQIHVTEKGDIDNYVMIGENLKKQILLWMEDREKYFNISSTKALFLSSRNQRISYDSVRRLLLKYTEGIIDKHVTPHVMRHSCATNLYDKTGDIYLCAKQLHHKNVTTTQRYAEISKKKQKEAIDTLDSMISFDKQ